MRPFVCAVVVCLGAVSGCTNPGEEDLPGPGPEPGTHVEDTTCQIAGEADPAHESGPWFCVRASKDLAADEVGFFEVPSYVLEIGAESRPTTPTRIFYAFQRADEAPENKPIVVVFNGGPGAATTPFLLTTGVARRIKDPGAGAIVENPNRWTKFANLLFVDARKTGFSYDLRPEADEETFTLGWHPMVDATDVVRLTVGFLEKRRTELLERVVLAGESYGGTRINLMLSAALFGGRAISYTWDRGEPCADEDLKTKLDAYFGSIVGDSQPENAARIFGRQIHLQGLFARGLLALGQPAACSDGSLAGEMTCTGDLYDVREPPTDPFSGVDATIATVVGFEDLLGFDVRDVPGLQPADRLRAARVWRVEDEDSEAYEEDEEFQEFLALQELANREESADLAAVLGPLTPEDRYFKSFSGVGQAPSRQAYYDGDLPPDVTTLEPPVDDDLLDGFLDNLAYTEAFVTDAQYDAILGSYQAPALIAASPRVEEVTVLEPTNRRTRAIRVTGLAEHAKVIPFPAYEAGHMIPLTDAANLASDVERWLAR
jgi:hypothetical protein